MNIPDLANVLFIAGEIDALCCAYYSDVVWLAEIDAADHFYSEEWLAFGRNILQPALFGSRLS